MKNFFVLSVISLILSQSLFAGAIKTSKPVITRLPDPKLDLCPECVDFMNDAIDDLLQLLLNGGVLGSCGDLCGQLSEQLEQVVCNLLCDYVGIEEFINIINETDPDPIYICQEMDACPVVNGGTVTINKANVVPAYGAEGATFNINMIYTVVNATGPGGLTVLVLPASPFDNPMSDFEFEEGQAPGQYSIQWQIQAQPSEGETFAPGVYQVQVAVCAGDCTTIHPYGGVYAYANTQFSISNNTVAAN